MADNFVTDPGAAGAEFVSREISHSGDTVQLSGAFIMGITGTEGAYTAVAINGDATNGLDVDVTRVSGTVTVDGSGVTQPISGDVTNAGTFAVQVDGAALTSLQLLDDVVATLGTTTYTETTTKANVIGAVRNDANGALVDTDNEIAPLQVNADGALYVHSPNKISTNNSSTATLLSAATFTGVGEDVSQFSVVTVTIDASHDSATDGMTLQFSSDNTNWDDIYLFTYTAANGARRFQLPVTGQFFRIVYTNGGTNQTHFRAQTILHDNATLTTIHRLSDDTDPDRSAQIVKAAIIAQAAGTGDFVSVQATTGGNLKTSLEEIDAALLGGGVEAGALLVTIASDSTGVLSVDDNGGSLTVDGAVTATLDAETTKVIGSVIPVAAATGGMSFDMLALAAEDNDKVIKGSAGTLYYISVQSLDATPVYLKLFDAASITPGTTSADLQFMCPANATAALGAGIVLDFSPGIEFATGIVALVATGIALDNNTAVSANEVVVTLGFE